MGRLRRDESGQAIAAGIALSFVMAILIVTIFAVWTHSNDATVADRSRTQGLQSAEAGISAVIDALTRSVCVADLGMSSPVSLTVGGKVVGQYQAVVRLPAEAGLLSPVLWNPNQQTSPGCTTAPPADADRVITAWGYGPNAASSRKVLRKVQVTVRVAALRGFRFACFASGSAPDGVLSIKNNMVVNGDCYARTVSETFNNIVANGVLMTPGDVTTKNNAVYQGSIWAGGSVTVGNNTVVQQNVTSATSSITLANNAQVLGNATAAATISLSNGAAVYGARCPATEGAPGCPTNVPPALTLPTLRCEATDVGCWQAIYGGELDTSHTSATLTAWLAANKNNLTGQFYLNDPAGTVTLDNDSTVTGPLTIITTGKLTLSRTLSTQNATVPPSECTPPGGPHTCEVVFVSLNSSADAIHVVAPRLTTTPTISLLLFTTGTLKTDSGANPISFSGSTYAANLDLQSNGMTVVTSQDLVDYPPPFVEWTTTAANQYTVVPLSWREQVPLAPV